MSDLLSEAYNYYNRLPDKLKAAASEEAQAMGVEVIQFIANKIRGSFGSYTNSSGYKAQEQGAKRSRYEARKDSSGTLVPAQLRIGRGAELSFQQQNILKPILFKTGEPTGRSIVSAFARERMLYRAQTVSHAFAYKMQLQEPSFLSDDAAVPINRFVVHNVFRHVLMSTQNTVPTNIYGNLTTSWNNSLGPDKSYVRRLGRILNGDAPATGSAISVPPTSSGLNPSLQSPYRYPQNGDYMFARMSRRALENFGWNANPMKFASIAAGSGSVTTLTNLQTYPNAASSTSTQLYSSPNRAPVDEPGATSGVCYYYKTQNSRGELAYNFTNEGTNPIVVDVVITRMKKGNALTKKDLIDQMVDTYQTGYMNYSYVNKGQANFAGQPNIVQDVTTNARGPFLPAKALDNYRVTTNTSGSVTAQSAHPFKQVARDQFIIAGGASRAWSMFMQSMDYDARKYAQYDEYNLIATAEIETNDENSSCVDDLSYILSVAVSGVPAPYIEQPASGAGIVPISAVIDRRGSEASCSVTGMYKEHCHPCYLSMSNNEMYVNGRLDIAHYDTGAAPILGVADILSVANATRGSTESSALISLGPINTVGGG